MRFWKKEKKKEKKKHTQFQKRVHKPHPISDQNGQNLHPITNVQPFAGGNGGGGGGGGGGEGCGVLC